jgi:hypothetical protein
MQKTLFKVILKSDEDEVEKYFAGMDHTSLILYLDNWQRQQFRSLHYYYKDIEVLGIIEIIEKP